MLIFDDPLPSGDRMEQDAWRKRQREAWVKIKASEHYHGGTPCAEHKACKWYTGRKSSLADLEA